MVFLTCLILVEFLPFSYTAPKLGHVLFDPLSYEAAMFVTKNVLPSTSNDALLKFLRVKDKTADTTKKPCLGYDYDDKLCKLLNDRIICGYNKNLGQPKGSETVIDIGNGCFIRGDRVECGYITGPYLNSRRPSQSENDVKNAKLKATEIPKTVAESTTKSRRVPTITTNSSPTTIISSTPPTTTVPTTTSTFSKPTTIITTIAQELKKIIPETTTKRLEPTTTKPKFMCVDKNNSLFCYEIKESKYFIY